MAGKPKQIKVCLTNQGEDSETPWADDLGPAPGPSGSRKVRLINVPFLHAKPTWGDVIVVSPVDDGFPTWDRDAVPWQQIGSRIAEDGGRWAMIVDYAPHPDAKDAFDALAHACAEIDAVCEGAWGPRKGEPGRAYIAVKNELSDDAVMTSLRAASLPCELIQIHPEPMVKPSRSRVKQAAPPPKPPPSKAAPPPKAAPPKAAKAPAAKASSKSAPAPSPAAAKRATKPATKPVARPTKKPTKSKRR